MKQVSKEILKQVQSIATWTLEFRKKVAAIEANQSADKVKSLELLLEKKEKENIALKKGEENFKEILNTLTQQNKLYQT